MFIESPIHHGFSVVAYQGDAKTLLAFNLAGKKSAKGLSGFTIHCRPHGQQGYYLLNNLRFKSPGDHAQDTSLPATSSFNAPFHKFRWLHVPGSAHQGTRPVLGKYTYTVTPRFFDGQGSLAPIDPSLGISVDMAVQPFTDQRLELGFTRGFVQSQAFVHHFGPKPHIRPAGKDLVFDTSNVAGTDPQGQPYTYEDQYRWLGFTAREKVFNLIEEVRKDSQLSLKVFAYDLNEPDLIGRLLELGKQGRLRIILDNASLHHDAQGSKPEDGFEKRFTTDRDPPP